MLIPSLINNDMYIKYGAVLQRFVDGECDTLYRPYS